ncbi:MAG: MucB/RseB C-terminal domain-containing protein [Bdellovibrio bacteriovorus]
MASAEGGDQERARDLLEHMNRALRSLGYEGTLVHLSENHLETLHLVHRIDGGRVQERLVSLSGPVRAVTRQRDRVTCVMPDGQPISVKSHLGPNLLRSDRIEPALLADRYQFAIEGVARVAGRDTDVIAIKPRDALRYGYRLHLDRATRLPLKTDLIDLGGEPLEQLMFTSLVLQDDTGNSEIAPASASADSDGPGFPDSTRWRFDGRPPGFEPVMYDVLRGPSGTDVDHFVFSDRLSAYSVYIEPGTTEGLVGVTRTGAIHAAGGQIDGHQVTVVGEVPAATVEAALAGVRAESGAP